MSDFRGITFHADADIDSESLSAVIGGALHAVTARHTQPGVTHPGWHATVTLKHPSFEQEGDEIVLEGLVKPVGDQLRLIPSDGERSTGYPTLVPLDRVLSVVIS